MRVAIFASGNGTNFEILAQQFQNHDLPGDLVLLFCDHPTAHVIDRAKRLKVPYETFTVKECGGKPAYEKRILKVLQDYQIDFVALAGYMRVVGPTILDHFGVRSSTSTRPTCRPTRGCIQSNGPLPITKHKPGSPSTTSTPGWTRAQSSPKSTW